MKQEKELYQALRNISDKGMGAVTLAKVKAVDLNDCTCTVLVDDMEITKVRLKATSDDDNGFKIFPKTGSFVLIQRLSNGDHFLAMTSESQNVKWTVGDNGMTIEMDSTIAIRNAQQSMLTLMLDFIDICMTETHLTNSGPSLALKTTDLQKFQTLKGEFQKLFKK